jgi:4-oxalocrotonate tautomerase
MWNPFKWRKDMERQVSRRSFLKKGAVALGTVENKQLADAIVKDVVTYAKCDESSVSVTIEEIKPAEWAEKVYKPDILNKQDKLYKKPGYST